MCVREQDYPAIRVSTASSSLEYSEAEFTAVRFALHLQRKRKMSVTFPALPLPLKRVFAPACVAGQNVRLALPLGPGHQTQFLELYG